MGLPDPNDVAAYDERLAEIMVGGPQPLGGRLEVRDYDARWPDRFEREAAQVSAALGERVVRLEHVGSTSVPGLPAKPIIDMVLEVSDSAREADYLPDLEAAGYVLRIREADWFEHRMFTTPEEDVHLHVFSAHCPETERMVLFRDWLRANAADRQLYVETKRDLAARQWKYMAQYADAKHAVIAQIMAKAASSSPGQAKAAGADED